MLDFKFLKGVGSVKVTIRINEKAIEVNGRPVIVRGYIYEEFDLPARKAVHALASILDKLTAELNNEERHNVKGKG